MTAEFNVSLPEKRISYFYFTSYLTYTQSPHSKSEYNPLNCYFYIIENFSPSWREVFLYYPYFSKAPPVTSQHCKIDLNLSLTKLLLAFGPVVTRYIACIT